jgi:hypothetical protein
LYLLSNIILDLINMPYCSIQEAWGNSFNKENNIVEHFDNQEKKYKKKKRKKKHRNNYKQFEAQMPEFNNDTEFENWKYNNNLLEERKKDKKDNEYNYYFTRGIDKLPEHNGNEKRVDQEEISFEKDIITEEDGDDEISNVYEEDSYGDEIKNNEVVPEEKGSKHNLSFVVNKLEKIIDLLSTNNSGDNNLTHGILFIFTGIFIIFIIDNAFRMGKNFRN